MVLVFLLFFILGLECLLGVLLSSRHVLSLLATESFLATARSTTVLSAGRTSAVLSASHTATVLPTQALNIFIFLAHPGFLQREGILLHVFGVTYFIKNV